jgi:hypothetical protein
MKQKVRAPASRPNSDSAPRATVLARHTEGASDAGPRCALGGARRAREDTRTRAVAQRMCAAAEAAVADAVNAVAPSPPHTPYKRRSTRPSTCRTRRPGQTLMI